ncbi:Tigger transposable element-derived protein 6 [Entomortierella lignicola]|nr:Tigger transposable element-derived protein 6 [Entomortierella lignicola]
MNLDVKSFFSDLTEVEQFQSQREQLNQHNLPQSHNDTLQSQPSPVENEYPQKAKAKRQKYSLDHKLEVIDACDGYQSKGFSFAEISTILRMPRTSVITIYKQKTTIENALHLNSETCRILEPRTGDIEVVLIHWLKVLKGRGIEVSRQKLRTQAIEIHRMLSIKRGKPLSPFMFSTSWYNGFLTRLENDKSWKETHPPSMNNPIWKTMVTQSGLDQALLDDVYTCDLTSMFLSIMPAGQGKGKGKDRDEGAQEWNAAQYIDHDNASVLLCCNGSGNDKLSPQVFFRGASIEKDRINALKEYLLVLEERGQQRGRFIYLMVNRSMWPYLYIIEPRPKLKVIVVPDALRKSLPMNTSLLKEFKAYFHSLLINSYPNKSSMEPLYAIKTAWDQVPTPVIKHSFEKFQMRVGIPRNLETNQHSSVESSKPGETELQRILNEEKFSDTARLFEYYRFQDGDNGPLDYLWDLPSPEKNV